MLYPVLAQRSSAAVSQVWSIPALAVAAQSFLIAAALNRSHDTPAAAGLTATIGAVGLGSTLLMYKLDQAANLDRLLLDAYERRLLGSEHPLRLRHRMNVDERDPQIRLAAGERPAEEDTLRVRLGMAATRNWRPTFMWFGVELIVTAFGCAAPWLP